MPGLSLPGSPSPGFSPASPYTPLMLRRAVALLVPALMVTASLHAEPPAMRSEDPHAAVAHVLDDWHDAAARADEARYFSHFAPGGVFLGTDPGERWTAEAFHEWARPYFARGKAWSFTARERHVAVSEDGRTAWFDEKLDTANMGECRGSGVLTRVGGAWKIALYDLSIPIPNPLTKTVVGLVREEKGKSAPLH